MMDYLSQLANIAPEFIESFFFHYTGYLCLSTQLFVFFAPVIELFYRNDLHLYSLQCFGAGYLIVFIVVTQFLIYQFCGFLLINFLISANYELQNIFLILKNRSGCKFFYFCVKRLLQPLY